MFSNKFYILLFLFLSTIFFGQIDCRKKERNIYFKINSTKYINKRSSLDSIFKFISANIGHEALSIYKDESETDELTDRRIIKIKHDLLKYTNKDVKIRKAGTWQNYAKNTYSKYISAIRIMLEVVERPIMAFDGSLPPVKETEQQKKETEQQKQEYITALKNWFDSGDLIVEVTISGNDLIFVHNAPDSQYGYTLAKARINKVLKGDLKAGTYINLNPNYPGNTEVYLTNGGEDVSKIVGERAIIKIHKTNTKEAFTTENAGVYVTDGNIYRMEPEGFDMHGKWIDGKKTVYNSTDALYKMLHDCCGVNR
jgi:hypothetical protein